MAAPTYQGVQEASAAGIATLTIGAGLGLAADDIILAAAWSNGTNAGTIPAFGGTYTGSWTEIVPDGDDLAPQLSLRWSRAVGAHSGQTITLDRIGASFAAIIQAISVRGARTSGSPIGGVAAALFADEPPVAWTPAISPQASDALVVWGIGDLQATADQLSGQAMADSAMTEREDVAPGAFMGTRAATLAQAGAVDIGTLAAIYAYASTIDRRFWAVTVESQAAWITKETTSRFRSRRPMPMMRGPDKDTRAMGRLR